MSQLKLTQVRSSIGCTEDQRNTLTDLGLRRIRHSVVQANTPSIRGMVKKVIHLLKVEEIAG